MAQRVHVILEDDIDGSKASETVRFGLDGVNYEIDLSDEHAAQLREALAQWTAAARRVAGRRTSKKTGSDDTAEIRAWAQRQGLAVSDRGRISREIRDAYAQAH